MPVHGTRYRRLPSKRNPGCLFGKETGSTVQGGRPPVRSSRRRIFPKWMAEGIESHRLEEHSGFPTAGPPGPEIEDSSSQTWSLLGGPPAIGHESGFRVGRTLVPRCARASFSPGQTRLGRIPAHAERPGPSCTDFPISRGDSSWPFPSTTCSKRPSKRSPCPPSLIRARPTAITTRSRPRSPRSSARSWAPNITLVWLKISPDFANLLYVVGDTS